MTPHLPSLHPRREVWNDSRLQHQQKAAGLKSLCLTESYIRLCAPGPGRLSHGHTSLLSASLPNSASPHGHQTPPEQKSPSLGETHSLFVLSECSLAKHRCFHFNPVWTLQRSCSVPPGCREPCRNDSAGEAARVWGPLTRAALHSGAPSFIGT